MSGFDPLAGPARERSPEGSSLPTAERDGDRSFALLGAAMLVGWAWLACFGALITVTAPFENWERDFEYYVLRWSQLLALPGAVASHLVLRAVTRGRYGHAYGWLIVTVVLFGAWAFGTEVGVHDFYWER